MLRHVLLIKVEDNDEKEETLNFIKEEWMAMMDEIEYGSNPVIQENVYPRESNSDLCMTSDFESKEELSDYLPCEGHQAFLDKCGKYFKEKATLDYEF